jgi:hypothetical protein
MVREFMAKAELEAVIMERIRNDGRCADVVHVSVQSNGLHPPQPTWDILSVERHPTPGTPIHNPFLMAIINDARNEFDLAPE